MWKQPSLITNELVNLIWRIAQQDQIWSIRYPNDVVMEYFGEANQTMRKLLQQLARLIPGPSPEPAAPNKTRREMKSLMIRTVQTIETAQNWKLLPELYKVATRWQQLNGGKATATMLVAALQILAGTESRYLVGTRGNRPAWKEVNPPVGPLSNKSLLLQYSLAAQMEYVDQSDVGLYPALTESFPGALYDWPAVTREQIRQLMEAAYYNQRYVVHPEGAYVRLRQHGPIKGMTLKTKPGLYDRNYLDFIAVFEIDAAEIDPEKYGPSPLIKKVLQVSDGNYLVTEIMILDEDYERLHRYFAWVTALIYHDLVTARVIQVASPENGEQTAPSLPGDNPSQWVYIPRKVKKETLPPRLPLTNPRLMMPHKVSGHLRRGNLTERHREELQKFERETGLKVLQILERNPGHTFVRPHVSPSGEGLYELPRFIHARLQSDIDGLLRQPIGYPE